MGLRPNREAEPAPTEHSRHGSEGMPALKCSWAAAPRNEATVSETSHTWITINPTRSLQLPQDVSKAYLSAHEATSRQTDSADEPCPSRNHSTLGNSESSCYKPYNYPVLFSQNY